MIHQIICICVQMYIHIYRRLYIYIYIYVSRERERDRQYVYVYTYIISAAGRRGAKRGGWMMVSREVCSTRFVHAVACRCMSKRAKRKRGARETHIAACQCVSAGVSASGACANAHQMIAHEAVFPLAHPLASHSRYAVH